MDLMKIFLIDSSLMAFRQTLDLLTAPLAANMRNYMILSTFMKIE